jgi:hypothetical protein
MKILRHWRVSYLFDLAVTFGDHAAIAPSPAGTPFQGASLAVTPISSSFHTLCVSSRESPGTKDVASREGLVAR